MMSETKTALITGAAQRLGRAMALSLHHKGYDIVIHYSRSKEQARELLQELNRLRPGSALIAQADLAQLDDIQTLREIVAQRWERLDVLINNAARFFPGKIEETRPADWDVLLNTNLRAPFFLCQAFSSLLKATNGCIINLVDIYADRPLDGHPVYSISKAGMAMLTKTLAKEMGPEVRVNGIAPGAILWPDGEATNDTGTQKEILDRTVLKKTGAAADICNAALFLIDQAPYVTGQIIRVDGGRSLNQ